MKNTKIAVIILVVACAVAALFMFTGNKNKKTEVAPVSTTPEVEKKVEKPVVEAPVVATPVFETPAEEVKVEEPVAEAPVVETPVAETPVVETPVEEVKAEEPVAEAPVVETPVAETPVSEAPVVEVPAEEARIIDEPALTVAAYISPFSFRGVYFYDDDTNYESSLLSTYGLAAKIKARYNFYKNVYVALDLSEQTYFEKHYGNYNDLLLCAKLGHKSYFCENAYTFAETGVGVDVAAFEGDWRAYLTAELEFGLGYCINENLSAEVTEEITWNWQKAHDGWKDASAFKFNTYVGLVYKF